jgi:hypothetical protein
MVAPTETISSLDPLGSMAQLGRVRPLGAGPSRLSGVSRLGWEIGNRMPSPPNGDDPDDRKGVLHGRLYPGR